ncbi:MAG: hypothetical protein CMJ78_10925 [Planctomycetaceae bacterium]|nr:hypothetical protein [Planctomycetaceae bacterium]
MRNFTAIVQREDDGWVATCPEIDVASQGDTDAEALANLQEAIELLLDVASPEELEARLNSDTYLKTLEVNVG